VRIGVHERVEQRPDGVDRSRAVARQKLERDQRRPATGRALVLDAAPEQLELLTKAELADRAVRDGPLLVARAAGRGLDLLVPLRPKLGKLSLGPALRQLVRLGGGFGEGQLTAARLRGAGPT